MSKKHPKIRVKLHKFYIVDITTLAYPKIFARHFISIFQARKFMKLHRISRVEFTVASGYELIHKYHKNTYYKTRKLNPTKLRMYATNKDMYPYEAKAIRVASRKRLKAKLRKSADTMQIILNKPLTFIIKLSKYFPDQLSYSLHTSRWILPVASRFYTYPEDIVWITRIRRCLINHYFMSGHNATVRAMRIYQKMGDRIKEKYEKVGLRGGLKLAKYSPEEIEKEFKKRGFKNTKDVRIRKDRCYIYSLDGKLVFPRWFNFDGNELQSYPRKLYIYTALSKFGINGYTKTVIPESKTNPTKN